LCREANVWSDTVMYPRARIRLPRLRLVMVLAVVAILLVSTVAHAAPALDPTFGYGGIATVGPGLGGGSGFDVAVQPNTGRVIVIGVASSPVVAGGQVFQAAAFIETGSLDTTFGTGGVARIAVEGYGKLFPTGGTVLAGGKVLLIGYGRSPSDRSDADDGLLVRLTQDGDLDTTFGTGGVARIRARGWNRTHLRSVKQRPDGRLIVVGDVAPAFTTDHTAIGVWRRRADGTRDGSFADRGERILDLSVLEDVLYFVELSSSGRIVASGRTTNNATFAANGLIVALTPDGALDPTFNRRGWLRVHLEGYPSTTSNFSTGLALGPHGAIYDLEPVQEGLTITKYTPRGTINGSFNDSQRVHYNVGNNAYGLALDGHGRILAVVQESAWSLLRWASDGAGPTHGVLLRATVDDFTVALVWANGVGVAPDGSYFVAGKSGGGLMAAAHVTG
jgi:uncharacterized delta-60 repeat protein